MHPPSSQRTDPPCTPASDSLPIAHQKDTRSYVTKHLISNFVLCQSLSPFSCFISTLSGVSIPKTLQNALSDPGWRHPLELKMTALHHIGTWNLVPLPLGKHFVGCKWVYLLSFTLWVR